MDYEFLSQWVNVAIIAPLAVLGQRIYSINGRVSTLEEQNHSTDERLTNIESKLDGLCDDVSFIKGQLERHFSNSS